MSTATETIGYACPSWCERPDHEADDLGLGDVPYHYGPTFGAFIGVMTPGAQQPLGTLDDENRDDRRASDFRQLAVDAVAAAEWLEAQA